jgi:hypothetical protein
VLAPRKCINQSTACAGACESAGVLAFASGVGLFAARVSQLSRLSRALPEKSPPLACRLGSCSQCRGVIRKHKR